MQDALEIFECAELDKTNMLDFFKSVHTAGTTVTPAHLLAAVQNADKCQVNPGANITTGPGVFHIVASPPQASKTALSMLFSLKDAIRYRMPSVVMTMNKKAELGRMKRSLDDSTDHFAKYCRAIATSSTPGIKAIYPIESDDRIEEYRRDLKRWYDGDSDQCPIYFLLFNDKKLALLATVIDVVGSIVGVDANGRVKLAFRHDEGDQISKTCNRSSVSEKSLMGDAAVANGLLNRMSSLNFVTSTLPSLMLVPVPLGNRRPIMTELEPSRNYVGYEESDTTGLRRTIVRLEMDSPSEYIQFVSEQAGAHGGMVFISGSTKSGVDKGRTERARAAAIEFKTTPGWCMIAWSSDELHVFAADPNLTHVFESAPGMFSQKPVLDPETHQDTGVIYFYRDGRHRKKGTSDYPALISFLLERLPSDCHLKTILFAKEMADRGTSICSANHKHHLGSLYVSFRKDSTCEYIRQVAGRAPQMIKPEPGREVRISLCASAATHETHKKAVRNCVFATDYLKKHFSEGAASLDGTLKEFGDKVDAARCDSVQDETSGAMMFAKSTISRGTLSTKSKKKVKQVEKAAKKRRVEINHTYLFGEQGGEAADIPVRAMAQEEAAAPMVDPPVLQPPMQEEVADVLLSQNAMAQEEAAAPVGDPPELQSPVQEEASVLPPPLQIGGPSLSVPPLRVGPSVVQPPVQEEASVLPPPLQIGWPLPPSRPFPPQSPLVHHPLSMMQSELPVQQNVVRQPLGPIVRQPTAGPRAPPENHNRNSRQNVARQPLGPIVRQPTAGPRAPTGDPELDVEEVMLEHLVDFINIIKSVLEDADEDSRTDGVGVPKMAKEIQDKALYYGWEGTNVAATEVVKYVCQKAGSELAKARVVFEANGQGGGVFKFKKI